MIPCFSLWFSLSRHRIWWWTRFYPQSLTGLTWRLRVRPFILKLRDYGEIQFREDECSTSLDWLLDVLDAIAIYIFLEEPTPITILPFPEPVDSGLRGGGVGGGGAPSPREKLFIVRNNAGRLLKDIIGNGSLSSEFSTCVMMGKKGETTAYSFGFCFSRQCD